MAKPLILITNDDGYDASGIRHLTEFAKEFGELVVVAPKFPQSGMGHAVTISTPIWLILKSQNENITEYICSGTPVDSVKLALDKVCYKKPDLILSGINHGVNSSVNVIYSGTMGAAIEGALSGVTSIGFSLNNFSPNADFSAAKEHIKNIIRKVLNGQIEKGVCLNVNIPDVPKEEIKGIKICRQAKAYWVEEFEERKDPHNRQYFWLKGYFNNLDNGTDTDEYALKNNFISIVPVTLDFTEHERITELKSLLQND